jgi:hypothetical protein
VDVIADFQAVIQKVRDARPVPFSASAIIDRKELLERLEGLLEAVPGELKKARWIIEDRDEVLGRIQHEAQETLERARQERDRMVSRPEVDRAASLEAERIIEGAKAQARQVRLEAEHFVDGKLASLEVGLQKMLALVQSASASFPDRSAPVRPSGGRSAAQRAAGAGDDEAEGLRPADPLDMPHGDVRAPGLPVEQRRRSPKSQGTPGQARPKVHRPAQPPAPSAPGPRPGGNVAGTSEDSTPGTMRSLGLGSPGARPKPNTPLARTPGAPGAGRARPPRVPPAAPAAPDTKAEIRPAHPARPSSPPGVVDRTGEIASAPLSSTGAPEPGDGGPSATSPTTLF